MKRNKILIISLCTGLLFSSFSNIPFSFASESVQRISDVLFGEQASTSSLHQVPPLIPPTEQSVTTETYEMELQGNFLMTAESGASLYPNSNTPQNDKYNFSADDVQQLMREGYSLQDILKADMLGNQMEIEPRKLLTELKVLKKDWTAIEESLNRQKYGQQVDELKKKYPDAAEILSKERFSTKEELALLFVYNDKLVPSMQNAIEQYKKDKSKAIENIYKANEFYGHVSDENKKKYGLTDQDVKNLRMTDENIQKMEQAQAGVDLGISAKEAIQNLKSYKYSEDIPKENEAK